MILYLLVGISSLVLAITQTRRAFWIFLFLYMNPGGVSQKYLGKAALGGIYFKDIFFLLMIFCFVFAGARIGRLLRNRDVKIIFYFMIFWSLYSIFIHYTFVPGHSMEFVLRNAIIKERHVLIYSPLLILPFCYFISRDMYGLFRMIVWSSFILFVAFIVSLLSGNEIIVIREMQRWAGSEVIRYGIGGEAFMMFTIPIALTIMILRYRVINKTILFFVAFGAAFTTILSLTRQNLFTLFFWGAIPIFLIYNITKRSFLKANFRYITLLGVFIGLMLVFTPKYISYILRASQDVILTFQGENKTDETRESRFEYDVPNMLEMISKKPVLGTGGKTLARTEEELGIIEGRIDITDVPLLGHIMLYGFVGILLYSYFYFLIIKKIIQSGKLIRKLVPSNRLIPLTFLFYFTSASYFLIKFIIEPYSLYLEITKGLEMYLLFYCILIIVHQHLKIYLSNLSQPN